MGSINSSFLNNIFDWEGVQEKIIYAYKIQYYLVHFLQKKHEKFDQEVKSHGTTSSQSNFRGR